MYDIRIGHARNVNLCSRQGGISDTCITRQCFLVTEDREDRAAGPLQCMICRAKCINKC